MYARYESPNDAFYRSPRWRRIVKEATQAPGAHCAYGISPRCTGTKRLEVHHPIPPRGDEDLFFDPENRELACHNCHAEITLKEVRMRRTQGGRFGKKGS
jgi:5-methylcytosine-specific restriction endonuclease McrA